MFGRGALCSSRKLPAGSCGKGSMQYPREGESEAYRPGQPGSAVSVLLVVAVVFFEVVAVRSGRGTEAVVRTRAAGGGADVLLAEAVEGVAGDREAAADGRDAFALVEAVDDLAAVGDQGFHLGVAALTASELHAPLAAQGQGFARAHGDEVALDLGDQPECEAEHLAVERVVERIAVLGAVEAYLLFEQPAYDSHNLGERAAQS